MSLKTPRKAERPVFWIVAGPNGSGKSSLYNRTDIEGWGGSVWIINPDLLTATIVEAERMPLERANLEAVQRIERWLDASLNAYRRSVSRRSSLHPSTAALSIWLTYAASKFG